MSKTTRAVDFLQNMQRDIAAEPPPKVASEESAKSPASRKGLKHIGGYCDPDRVEKVAILRARLRMDNSELLALAIDELYRKHTAKRAFGDA